MKQLKNSMITAEYNNFINLNNQEASNFAVDLQKIMVKHNIKIIYSKHGETGNISNNRKNTMILSHFNIVAFEKDDE